MAQVRLEAAKMAPQYKECRLALAGMYRHLEAAYYKALATAKKIQGRKCNKITEYLRLQQSAVLGQ